MSSLPYMHLSNVLIHFSLSDWIHDPSMPQGPSGPLEKDGNSATASDAPIFSTVSRSRSRPQDSFQLGRIQTSQSMTHDMSTGNSREGGGRGYIFDQADDQLPPAIRRYTSRKFPSLSIVDLSLINPYHSQERVKSRPREIELARDPFD